MNRNAFLFLLLALFGGTALCAQPSLPSAQVYTLDGKAIDIQDYVRDGRPTVISFWATWCAPCKKELDALAGLYEQWQQQYDVQVLAISIDDRRALPKMAPMVAAKGWPYTVLTDPEQALKKALNFQAIPQTFLLDRQGKLGYAHPGSEAGDEQKLEKALQATAGK